MNISTTLAESWHCVQGFKAKAWGALLLYLVIIAVMVFLMGLVLTFLDYRINQRVVFWLALIMEALLIPLGVGLRMLPVLHMQEVSSSPLSIFSYFRPAYLFRFYLNYFVVSVILYRMTVGIGLLANVSISRIFYCTMHHYCSSGMTSKAIQLGLLLFFIGGPMMAYFNFVLSFSNMMMADQGSGLLDTLPVTYKEVFIKFLKLLATLFIMLLVWVLIAGMSFAIYVGFAYAQLNWPGLAVSVFFGLVCLVWYFPWTLNVWALMYRGVYHSE